MARRRDGERDAVGRRPRGPIVAAVVLVLLAATLIFQAIQISSGAGFSVVGPGTIPLAAAALLLLLSLALVLRTTLLPDADLAQRAAAEEAVTDWPTVGIVAVLLVAYAFALGSAGYVIATGLFLPAAAYALGSRHLIRDVAIGFGVALVIYVGFTEFLGVRLPAGLLDGVL
jgi:putative tricarboxylic transport membrane protein